MVWCWNSKIRRTFKNTCAAYYGIHCLQLIPNTRDYCVKFYQIIWKYTDKRLLSTQKVTSSGIFWSKIFILLRVYGWNFRGSRFCRGLEREMFLRRSVDRGVVCYLNWLYLWRNCLSLPKDDLRIPHISIPNVTRDDRIGSAFNELFHIIHQTESGSDTIEWSFECAMFLHPFFLAPLAIYKDNCGKNISCKELRDNIDKYFNAICF